MFVYEKAVQGCVELLYKQCVYVEGMYAATRVLSLCVLCLHVVNCNPSGDLVTGENTLRLVQCVYSVNSVCGAGVDDSVVVYASSSSNVVLNCSLPLPVVWYKNNIPVPDSSRQAINILTGSLTFTPIFPSQSGWYSCATTTGSNRTVQDHVLIVGGIYSSYYVVCVCVCSPSYYVVCVCVCVCVCVHLATILCVCVQMPRVLNRLRTLSLMG